MRRIAILASIALSALIGTARAYAAENSNEDTKVSLIPKVTGMVNLRYLYDESKDDEHGFEVRRVRLGARGNLHKSVDYVLQAEYSGNVRLLDAYIRWKVMPEFNVQVGQFKVHYSQETLSGPISWLTAEMPTAVNRLNSYSDISGLKTNGRDIGLMFYGNLFHKELFDVLRYRVGVFNGNGYNVKDNNKKKDVAGMLWINPIRQFAFTGGYYYGTYGPKGNDHVRNRASAGVEWKDRKLTVRSEYLWGHTGCVRSNGVYAQAAYKVHQIVEPVVAYDFFKENKDIDVLQHNLHLGVNISPIDHLRIQASYVHTFYNNDQHNNLAELQAVLTF